MLMRVTSGIVRRIRAAVLRFQGADIAPNVWLRNIDIPRNHSDIRLESGVALDRGVTLLSTGTPSAEPRIQIGRSTYINRSAMIDASELVSIGAECMIGPFAYITDHDHGTEQGTPIHLQELRSAPTVIQKGAWIGAHASVLKGVTIGEGAVVGAGSVVTRDVEPNTIVAGVPARKMGVRQ